MSSRLDSIGPLLKGEIMRIHREPQILLVGLAAFVLHPSGAFATVRRVIPYPTGCHIQSDSASGCCRTNCDGSDWVIGKAYKSIQDAIADSSNGDEIWVKTGTYYPDICYDTSCTNNDRASTFKVSNPAVNLYGGFAGTETATSQRVLLCTAGDHSGWPCEVSADCPGSTCGASPTILSGDLTQDDGSGSCSSDSGCGSAETCTSGVCSAGGGPCSTSADCIECQAGTCSGRRDDNAYHVVTYEDAGATATVDGFVIKQGTANGVGNVAASNQGAAINIREKSRCKGGTNDNLTCLTSSGCPSGTCTPKKCSNDGAVCTQDSECTSPYICLNNACIPGGLVVKNSIIRNNYSYNHGAVNDHALASHFEKCLFDDNVSGLEGGALVVDNGDADIIECYFTDNSSNDGGAIWFGARSNSDADSGCSNLGEATLTDCKFSGNDAAFGGGAWIGKGAKPTFQGDECMFDGNSCIGSGGAVYVTDSGASSDEVRFEDCKFYNNVGDGAFGDGSGIYAINSFVFVDRCKFGDIGKGNISYNGYGAFVKYGSGTANIHNSLFVANDAFKGGAVRVTGGTVNMVNCTVVKNRATNGADGGGINNIATFNAYNSVFWENQHKVSGVYVTTEDAQIKGTVTVTYSDWQNHTGGTGNIDTDPLFATNYTDLHLQCDSPCIDAGTNTQATEPYDLDNNTRIIDSETQSGTAVDMGAYEEEVCDLGCEACCDSADCSGGTPYCKTSGTNTCVACLTDANCSSGNVCCNNVCEAGECCINSTCSLTYGTAKPYCYTSGTNTCVACYQDSHCEHGQECCNDFTCASIGNCPQ